MAVQAKVWTSITKRVNLRKKYLSIFRILKLWLVFAYKLKLIWWVFHLTTHVKSSFIWRKNGKYIGPSLERKDKIFLLKVSGQENALDNTYMKGLAFITLLGRTFLSLLSFLLKKNHISSSIWERVLCPDWRS